MIQTVVVSHFFIASLIKGILLFIKKILIGQGTKKLRITLINEAAKKSLKYDKDKKSF